MNFKIKYIFTILLIYFLEASINSQTIKFQKTMGRGGDDSAGQVILESDSTYYVAGTTSTLATGFDMSVTKFNKYGDTLWSKNYGGFGLDYGGGIKKTHDGNYLCTGHTLSFGTGNYDAYIVKINPQGDTLWTKAVGSPLIDLLTSCIILPNDDFMLLGVVDSTGLGLTDAQLIKMDKNGNMLWNKLYDSNNTSSLSDIVQTDDLGFVFTGSTKSYGAGDYDSFIIKIDSLGNFNWGKTYGGILGEGSFRIIKHTNGYVIVGNMSSFGQGASDIYLLKIDFNGTLLWAKTYGTATDDRSINIIQSTDGNFAISGQYGLYTGTNLDATLMKTDSSGNIQWAKRYGGGNYDAVGVTQTYDHGYFMAGSSNSFTPYYSAYFIKTDSLGNSGCNEQNLNLITQDITSLLTVTNPTPNVYTDPSIVAKNTQTIVTSGGLITNTLCYSVAAVEEINNTENEIKIYPNPSNGNFTIQLNQTKAEENASIVIFDVLGKAVYSKQNIVLTAGLNEINITTQQLPPGIYFCKLNAGSIFYGSKICVE